jgi:hypothetical protein
MKSIVFMLMSATLLIGCSQQRFVVMPAFTDIQHIERLKQGMSKTEVASTLELSPIDFYYLQDGVDVYVYNYRLTEKRIQITNNTTRVNEGSAVQNDHIDGLAARSAGIPHYTEWRKLYVSFKGDKMSAMITDAGKDDANAVLLQLASVQALSNDPQIKLVPRVTTDHNYVVPLDDKGGYITNNSVVTGTGSGQTIVGGSAEIAVLPKQETTRSATVSDEVNIFKRGKKKKGYSRSISYQRD